jgi:hypothetical protein
MSENSEIQNGRIHKLEIPLCSMHKGIRALKLQISKDDWSGHL